MTLPDIRSLAPEDLVRELGRLHDARLTRLDWSVVQQELTVSIDDLYSNFEDLPEYPGPLPARMTFRGVSGFILGVNPTEAELSIYDCEISRRSADLLDWEFALAPGGKLSVSCAAVEIKPTEP